MADSEPMTSHEKEVAYAAVALGLERARRQGDRRAIREWIALRKRTDAAPFLVESEVLQIIKDASTP